ncbi:hypothetical protein V8E55_006824 [Tylopilus felleus]
MEITPVVDRDRGQRRRAARRSLGDEEAEKPNPSFRLSTALTFDTLRARLGLASSRSQLVDLNRPDALYDRSSLVSTNTSNPRRPQASTSTRAHPQVLSHPTPIVPHVFADATSVQCVFGVEYVLRWIDPAGRSFIPRLGNATRNG